MHLAHAFAPVEHRPYSPWVKILDASRRADAHLLSASAGEFHSPSAERHYAPDLRIEPVHIDVDLHVDLEAQSAEGTVTHRLRGNVAGADTVRLDAVDFLNLRCDGAAHAYDGRILELHFDEPFAFGEERSVAIHYRVEKPTSGLFFGAPTEQRPTEAYFAATDHETERARYWLPTIDAPAARPTMAYTLRAQEDLTILAGGAFVSEEKNGDGTKTARWKLDQPCPSYLACFAIGDFVAWHGEDVDGIPTAAFASAKEFTAEQLELSFGRITEMLRWVPERLGVAFPYPKYFQFAVPGIGGAMENISLTSWDDRFVLNDDLAQEEKHLLDAINLHELAHTWFGDHVVCRDYAHAWLKEGWATYMESCWLDHSEGRDEMNYDLYAGGLAYQREAAERYERPIVTRRFDASFDMYDYHLYPGAAWRIHMLRNLLGEEVFWDATKSYLERFGGKVVETDDYRRLLEEKSGRSLARFFDQWIHSPGFPKLKGRFRFDSAKKQGFFELRQTQVDEKKGIPCFDLDLEVAWEIGEERQSAVMHFDGPPAFLAVPMERMPDQVRIDPEGKVLHALDFDPGDNIWRRQLGAGDVLGRIQAGRALCKSGKTKNIEALRDAFLKEEHWGVMTQWADALGRAKVAAAADALVAIVAAHEEPRSLAAVFRAAGNYREPALAKVIAERLEEGLPPRAAEAAGEALGAQRTGADVELLKEAASKQGWAGFAPGGALRGLAASRNPDVMGTLLDCLREAPTKVRPHAAQAVGALARQLEKRPREEAIEALEDALRDPNRRVRDAALIGLCGAGAKEKLGAIDAYLRTLPKQDQTRLRRHTKALRREDASLPKAERRIDELERKLAKLTERCERLEGKLRAKD